MTARKVEPDFDEGNGRFLLRLSKDEVGLGDQPVTFQGKTFAAKDEVHITIFGSQLGEELVAAINANPALRHRLQAAIAETAWHYELHDEWYHVVDREEETIIRMVGVPPLADFYRQVTSLTGVVIPPRPTHITFYTYNNREGIGIATEEEFRERVVGELSPQYLEEEE